MGSDGHWSYKCHGQVEMHGEEGLSDVRSRVKKNLKESAGYVATKGSKCVTQNNYISRKEDLAEAYKVVEDALKAKRKRSPKSPTSGGGNLMGSRVLVGIGVSEESSFV